MAAHIESGTTAASEHYSSKLLKHLGLVAGMYDELGIGELVDQLIVQDGEKRKVSIGQAIKAMIGIPLLMETLNGNNSDKASFRDTVKTPIGQMQSDVGLEYVTADSALYVAETLGEMNGFRWISRVPQTLTLARDIIHSIAPDLMGHPEQTAFRSLGTVYGSVQQRWVVVYSPQAYQRTLKTVNKHCLKQSTTELKDFEKLCKQDFACPADARKALAAFEKKLKMTLMNDDASQPASAF